MCKLKKEIGVNYVQIKNNIVFVKVSSNCSSNNILGLNNMLILFLNHLENKFSVLESKYFYENT